MDTYEFLFQGNDNLKLYAQGDTADECAEHGRRNCAPCAEGHIQRTRRWAPLAAKHETGSGSRVGMRPSQARKQGD
jgi:hypothetical protein